MNYTILDIETTWLSKYKHKITEIAAIKFDWNNIIWEYQTLINPERNIPTEITKLTWITNEMVSNAPKFIEIIPNFLNFIENDIIVAHNANFDYGFISENIYKHTGQRISNCCLCTRKLANRLLPELPKKNLWSICEFLSLKNERAHRAMWDTKVTVEIFKYFLNLLNKKWINNQLEIIHFQDKKICDCL